VSVAAILNTVTTVPAVAVPAPEVPAAAANVKEPGSGLVPVTSITVPPPALKPPLALPAAPPAPPG